MFSRTVCSTNSCVESLEKWQNVVKIHINMVAISKNNCELCYPRNVIKEIRQFKKTKYCFYVGERITKKYMYKYMDIETFIQCLKSSNIRFAEPKLWPDNYESRFYTADYSAITKDNSLIPQLYACCFTLNDTSEAAWKIYSYGKTGLASRCVQLRISKRRFREVLDSYAKSEGCRIYEGQMNYDLDEYEISHLHYKNSNSFLKIFNSYFSFKSYLSLLLLKRPAFSYENEYRYFIVPDKFDVNTSKDMIFPSIPWNTLISEVKVSRECTNTELDIIKSFLKVYDISLEPEKFDLYKKLEERITIGDMQ